MDDIIGALVTGTGLQGNLYIWDAVKKAYFGGNDIIYFQKRYRKLEETKRSRILVGIHWWNQFGMMSWWIFNLLEG